MIFFSRFPIIAWFIIIALLTSASVSYYTYKNVFRKQIEETERSEINRIRQRLIQLQGTVNDFNRRHDFNAIHREVSRLSSDPTMELIAIIDEHGVIRYSSLIEYRDTDMQELADINRVILEKNNPGSSGFIQTIAGTSTIVAVYPLDLQSHIDSISDLYHAYLYARFDLSHTIQDLRFRQQQEITNTTLIHFSLLFSGFLLLYLSMHNRIQSIISGIRHFSDGDYGTRIKLTGRDEFSKISSGFDAMASKLQIQNQNLIELTEQLREQHEELLLQEQDLRVTLNSIGDAVIATDASGLITSMNPVAQNLTGWSLDDAAGKPITSVFRIFNASNGETIQNPIDKVIKTGQTVYLSNNTTLVSRTGVEYQISDSAAPIRNESDEILGMVLIFNDVTEQYRLRKAVAKSERLLRSIMDNSPAVIYVVNSSAEFTYVNQKFLSVFNYKNDDIVGRKLHELFPDEVADTMYHNGKIALSAGQTLEIEENIHHGDKLHTYASIKFPLLDEAGEIYAICCISTDITDRKQQEQLLRRSQKMDALGKLTGGIAHDYNNMLGVIIGYSELLENALGNQPKLMKYASEIHHASERGANLTRKLLAFSRPQQNERQSLNINSLLLDRQDMLERVLTSRIKLEMHLDDDLWQIMIDSGDLEDAIVNISINAMHAMEDGGKFTIATKNERLNALEAKQLGLHAGDYIQLSFTDTGTGMDRETQERMFDPFFTSKQDLGAGLGLSQVYGLVESNGGAIKVYSEINQGTRIIIYLPRDRKIQSREKAETSIPTEHLQGQASILVVDDEVGLRSLAMEILTQNGYRVFTAANGREALEILKKESVDILLSDIIMPEMDGYELASQVSQQYPNISIQLASGYNDNRHVKPGNSELHANVLHKPFNTQDLLIRIKQLSQQAN